MKLFFIIFLSLPLLLAAQSVKDAPQIQDKEAAKAKTASAWIEFHQQALALKIADQDLKKKPSKENETTFNNVAQKVDLALKHLVEQKELVSEQFTFIPAKLSDEQDDLLQYCFSTANQVYGKSATREMFDMGYKKYLGIKNNPNQYDLKTRLPKRFNVMLKHILSNENLTKIKLPRPVTIDSITETKDLWIFFYKNLEIANDIAYDIKRNKEKTNPLEAAGSLIALNQVKKKLADRKILATKTYSFTFGQMSFRQMAMLLKLPNIEKKYGNIAILEMLSLGNTLVIKNALRPAVKAGKLKMNLADLNQNLTIYLPKREFEIVSPYLDKIKISQP